MLLKVIAIRWQSRAVTGCTVRKGSEVFSAFRLGSGKAAAGPKGSEQRLLWGSIERS